MSGLASAAEGGGKDAGTAPPREVVLRASDLTVRLGSQTILEHLELEVYRGEILGIVGASGTGKTVLLRTILGLLPKQSGAVEMFGTRYDTAAPEVKQSIDRRFGVMFQQGALFSSLSVIQNVQMPMREYLGLSQHLMDELALLKLELVGLPRNAAEKYPAQLSGGMTKRVALARALALDPEILFLDEPTSGLDPIGAAEFDELIETLRDTLDLTVVMVTHDLDSLQTICTRIAVLGERRVLVEGPMERLLDYDNAWVQRYFRGTRAVRHLGL